MTRGRGRAGRSPGCAQLARARRPACGVGKSASFFFASPVSATALYGWCRRAARSVPALRVTIAGASAGAAQQRGGVAVAGLRSAGWTARPSGPARACRNPGLARVLHWRSGLAVRPALCRGSCRASSPPPRFRRAGCGFGRGGSLWAGEA